MKMITHILDFIALCLTPYLQWKEIGCSHSRLCIAIYMLSTKNILESRKNVYKSEQSSLRKSILSSDDLQKSSRWWFVAFKYIAEEFTLRLCRQCNFHINFNFDSWFFSTLCYYRNFIFGALLLLIQHSLGLECRTEKTINHLKNIKNVDSYIYSDNTHLLNINNKGIKVMKCFSFSSLNLKGYEAFFVVEFLLREWLLVL